MHPDNDSGWIDITLLNGWAVYATGGFAKYRKIGKIVFVELYLSPTNATNNNLCTLESGIRTTLNRVVASGYKAKGSTLTNIISLIYSNGIIVPETAYDTTQDYYRISASYVIG